ncbi:hypothetical protein GGF46_002517 [Coemansia sp. RSA 552]|nr:hypothetical protein GGF46_002517 [Coemansia sp. RSA 552]
MAYSLRDYQLPGCHWIPQTKFALDSSGRRVANPVYSNVGGWAHDKSISQLQRLQSVFQRGEVWRDFQLLSRVFYRNWNQHRHSVYYRRLYELRRALRILDRVNVRGLLDQLIRGCFSQPVKDMARRAPKWEALPCALFSRAFALRIAGIARLVAKTRAICWNVYMQFTAQVAQTLFMPLAMVVQGISARLFVVLELWHQDLVAIYTQFVEWLPYLPACPESLAGKVAEGGQELVDPAELTMPMPFDTPAVRAKVGSAAKDSKLEDPELLAGAIGALAIKRSPGVVGEGPLLGASSGGTQRPGKRRKQKPHRVEFDDDDLGEPVG